MIVKVIRMTRTRDAFDQLRDNVFGLSRYVVDADPWAMALSERSVRSLSDYIVEAEGQGVEPGEKAGFTGSRNLQSPDLHGQQMEMLAVANAAPNVEHPAIHIIASWRADEQPTPDQIEDTIDTLLSTTGLTSSQSLFGEHVNTANRHVHLMCVRIDPVTHMAAGSEWLIEDCHQAIALLEERHGWAAEPNALYYARDGAVYDARAARMCETSSSANIADPASEVMIRDSVGRLVGRRDRTRIPYPIAEQRVELIRAVSLATNWPDLHGALDRMGLIYRQKGSGARIHAGEVSAKASAIDQTLSLSTLVARVGAFEQHPADREPGFDCYRAVHKAQLARLRAERQAANEALTEWANRQVASVADKRSALLHEAIRIEQRAAKAVIDAASAQAIRTCTEARFTTVERWQRAGSPLEPPEVPSPSIMTPSPTSQEASSVVPIALRAERTATGTHYFDRADRLLFTDQRAVVIVHRPVDPVGLDAALLIAADRWGTIRVTGSVEFQARCAARAAALNITIVDRDGRRLTPLRAKRVRAAVPEVRRIEAPPIDPARQAALDHSLAFLERLPVIMTRRREPGAAPLEIIIETDRFTPQPDLHTAALFEDDPAIQSLLVRHRERMFDTIRTLVRQFNLPLEKAPIVEKAGEGLGRAIFHAFGDDDVQQMLRVLQAERDREMRKAGQGRSRSTGSRQSNLTLLAELFHDVSWDPRDWPERARAIETEASRPLADHRDPAFGAGAPAHDIEQLRRLADAKGRSR